MPVVQLPVRRLASFVVLTATFLAMIAGTATAQDLLTDTPGTGDAALSGEEQAQQLMDAGEKALAEGNWMEALAAFDPLVRALKAQPIPNPLAAATFYTSRGRAFAGMEDYQAALADFNAAVEASDEYLPVRVFRGNMYLELGQPAAAYGDFQKAVELQRLNIDALFGLGKAIVQLGGAQQAIQPLTMVIEAPADNESANRLRAEAYSLRAQANSGILKFEEAHEDIRQSLALNPDDYETYFAEGAVYLREEKYAEAADAFQQAIDRYVPKDPESPEPYIQGYLTRAAALVEVGKEADGQEAQQQAYQAALDDCDKLLEELGESPIYAAARSATEFRRGVALRMMGQLEEAINALTEAININPDNSEAFFRRGICYYYVGEDDLALSDFESAAALAYDDPRIRLWEGYTLTRKGDNYEAIRAFGDALAESDRYVPAFVNRGLVYLAIGDYEKAIDDFNDAILLEPTVAGHYFKRGVAFERLGNYEKAADSFTHAANFDDHMVSAYEHAATALAALGQNELAAEYRKAAAQRAEASQTKP